MLETFQYSFDAMDEGGEGKLSWPQLFDYRVVQYFGHEAWRLDFFVDVRLVEPRDTTLILDTIADLVNRHPPLRTTYTPRGHGVEQNVLTRGSFTVSMGNARVGVEGDSPRALVPQLSGAMPMGALLLTEGGLGSRVILRISHLATDWWGINVLRRDFGEALAQPEQNAVRNQRQRTVSGLSLAAWESGDRGLAANAAALTHARKQLNEAPETMFPSRPSGNLEERYWVGVLQSPRLLVALTIIERHHGVKAAPALTGAIGIAAGKNAGVDRALLYALSSNRFDPKWRTYVGPMVQEATICLNFADCSLVQVLRRARTESILAHACAHYDPADMATLVDEVQSSRGVTLDKLGRALVLNVMIEALTPLTSGDESGQIARKSVFEWTDRYQNDNLALLIDASTRDDSVVITARIDTTVIAPDATERLLRSAEGLLVELATRGPGGDISPADLGAYCL